MRDLISVTLLLFLTAVVPAADDSKPKPLTRQEINDGWLQLFDGESLFGWNSVNDAKWSVFNGLLYPQANVAGPLVTTTAFNDYELRLEYQVAADRKVKIGVGCDAQGKTAGRGKEVPLPQLPAQATTIITVRDGRVDFRYESSSIFGAIAAATATIDDVPTDNPPAPVHGHIALIGNGVAFKSIKLRPLGTKPLFNGKDLAGWKVFPGDKYKSQFTVTKDGAINVKNGPGDLQTEGQWADFILQLECISNGKFLNSGVFFRALPNEYQQGYEAQIRNEFKDEPSQEYTLEIFDPKTNELKEKVKAKYTAVDYGTGAIYRRQPARKAVAKDGEWFTMTVMANGRHLATWVDGVQVADWTDHRPLNANGRNGCRLEKGCISFQGHDPTTDLSFRNIRIAELPRKD